MSRFQIPVIGDVHLGPGPRQAQRAASLEAITAAGLDLQERTGELGAWFYVGDIFDATSRPEDRNYFANVLHNQAAAAPVVIIRGNHDREGELWIFERLGTKWPIHIIEVPQVVTLLLASHQQIAIACFPWPWESALVAAGVPTAGIRAAARQALEPVFLSLGHELELHRQAGQATVFLAHATITGAVASNGQPQVGPGIEIDGELLAHLGDCPKLLGHIHKPQVLADAGAVYIGSIARMDFGELERKRWIRLEGEDHVVRDGPDEAVQWAYTFHDETLETPGLWKVDAIAHGSPDGAAAKLDWIVSRGPEGETLEPPASWAGQEVKVTLRYPLALRAYLEEWLAWLREQFHEAARLELEPIAVPDGGLRSPAVAAAVTLEAKVRAWADASGTVLPGHLAEALELLTHHPAEGVLDDVQASLDALLERKDQPA